MWLFRKFGIPFDSVTVWLFRKFGIPFDSVTVWLFRKFGIPFDSVTVWLFSISLGNFVLPGERTCEVVGYVFHVCHLYRFFPANDQNQINL